MYVHVKKPFIQHFFIDILFLSDVYTSVDVNVYALGPVQSGIVFYSWIFVCSPACLGAFYDLKQCLPISSEYLYLPSPVFMFFCMFVEFEEVS